ncbi:MAG: D-glycerate dehydrogenase [Candidatus Riflebacteria bacterium]|nr:D-glycerate dehydrogenase [Candidatus Riflebacteria bacterium]
MNNRKKVFVTREILPEGLELLKKNFDVDLWTDYAPPSKETIKEHIKNADAILTMLSDKIDAEIINAAPKLKIIAQLAVGYDNIDLEAAKKRGIYVTNTPDALTDASADFSFALLMAITRRVVEADKYVRAGNWKVAWHPSMMLGAPLRGTTLGIIGAGRIGQAMAKRGRGFDMKILYFNRSAKPEFEKECGAKRVDLDTLLKESDFVSLHVPLNDQTRGLINAEKLELMKKTAYLISNARGPVIEEKALYEALKKHKIAGAALDVFCQEPTPANNPLLELDNIVVAPHISSANTATRTKMSVMNAEDITAVLTGKEPKNIVVKP